MVSKPVSPRLERMSRSVRTLEEAMAARCPAGCDNGQVLMPAVAGGGGYHYEPCPVCTGQREGDGT